MYRLLNMFLKNKAADKEKNCYLKLYTEDEKDDPYRYIMLILQNVCVVFVFSSLQTDWLVGRRS